jgi:hypothetical protein
MEERDMARHTPKAIRAAAAATTIAAVLGGTAAAAASTHSGGARSGTEHFYLMTTRPDANRFEVIATGLFTASGTDIAGSKTDTVKLPGGTLKVNHSGPFHVIKQQFNPKTCFAVFEATAKIKFGGGTGKYAGITGSGNATINDLGIAPRNAKGACNPNATPVANEETITATGSVKL